MESALEIDSSTPCAQDSSSCSQPEQTSPRPPSKTDICEECQSSRGQECGASARGEPAEEVQGAAKQISRSRSRHKSRSASDAKSSSSSGTRSAEGVHFDWSKGLILKSKYKVVRFLGDGAFGRVLLADDETAGRQVAVKVIRDVERYTEGAMIEAEILTEICKADPEHSSRCVFMCEAFMHEQTHFCLVFEPLGTSLYDLLEANKFRGFWMQDVQVFARDVMQALCFLHGQLGIAHTDLKPENILLESMEPFRPATFPREAEWQKRQRPSQDCYLGPYMRPVSARVKLIDFGNATREHEHHSSIISTRQYRSPEVLLGLRWNVTSDLWSIGCILSELYVGELLFQSHNDYGHLALMKQIIGPIPEAMCNAASNTAKESYLVPDAVTGNWRLSWPECELPASWEKHVRRQLPLADNIPPEHKEFAEFLAALLQIEPGKRLLAINALFHPFLKSQFED